ncbi:MAG: hypothetical protein V1853_00140 [bacterium]
MDQEDRETELDQKNPSSGSFESKRRRTVALPLDLSSREVGQGGINHEFDLMFGTWGGDDPEEVVIFPNSPSRTPKPTE